MTLVSLFGALGTPLDEKECLHEAGLEKHLEEQWSNGLKGVLIAGSMGLMQLLRDKTYMDLVERSVKCSRGRGEVFIGAGDTSFARTRDRIEALARFAIDGIVVITPYFLKFRQSELLDYYRALADVSQHPIYIYDAPSRTGVKLELETVLHLAEHPNIRGIKCTCDADWTRELFRRVDFEFRVIASALGDMHLLLREGIAQHLDGLFALMPSWTADMAHAAAAERWDRVDDCRNRFDRLFELMRRFGSFASYTAIVNERGIPGNFAPAPLTQLTATERDILLADDIFRQESKHALRGPHAVLTSSRDRSNR